MSSIMNKEIKECFAKADKAIRKALSKLNKKQLEKLK